MSFIKKIADQVEQLSEKTKGNPFLHTVVDGFATFLFAPKTVSSGRGVHINDGLDLKRTMITVVLALVPCLLFGAYNVGLQHYAAYGMEVGFMTAFMFGLLQVLPIIVVSYGVGLGIEFFFAAKKGHAIEEGFLVTGMLIPLIMPPDIPLWMVGMATAFAVIIGKEAFGGTGMNILNVALTARVFVFFAYPTEISGDVCWVTYDQNFLHSILGLGVTSATELVDGFSGATPLALAAKQGWAETGGVLSQFDVQDMIMGNIPGSIGEMGKPAVLIGAAILILTGIASWQIMISMITGCAVMGLLLNQLGAIEGTSPFLDVPFYMHFIMGSFLFAMAFMATDPVTAAQTGMGKWIYGFLIGAIGLIVRVLNPAYPEGWMLAILLMNVFAPLIDHYVLQANINRRLKRATANG